MGFPSLYKDLQDLIKTKILYHSIAGNTRLFRE